MSLEWIRKYITYQLDSVSRCCGKQPRAILSTGIIIWVIWTNDLAVRGCHLVTTASCKEVNDNFNEQFYSCEDEYLNLTELMKFPTSVSFLNAHAWEKS